MAVLLMTDPSGHEVAAGNVTVLVRPRARARSGSMITSSGSTPSRRASASRTACRRRRALPPVEHPAERLAGRGEAVEVEQAEPPQVEHHLGHAAGQEDADGGMADRAVRQHVDEPRDAPVDLAPVLHGRPAEAGGVGDRR